MNILGVEVKFRYASKVLHEVHSNWNDGSGGADIAMIVQYRLVGTDGNDYIAVGFFWFCGASPEHNECWQPTFWLGIEKEQ